MNTKLSQTVIFGNVKLKNKFIKQENNIILKFRKVLKFLFKMKSY